MPASISSKIIVSPPPTAAMASATRESSPPEAVSATGPNGRPLFGRIRNAASSAPVAAGLALAQLDPKLAVAETDADQLPGHRVGEGRSRREPPGTQLGVQPGDLGLGRGERLGSSAHRVVPFLECRQLGAGRLGSRQEILERRCVGSGASASAISSSEASTCSSRPGSASSEARKRTQLVHGLAQRQLASRAASSLQRRARARAARAARRAARRRRSGRSPLRRRPGRAPRPPPAAACDELVDAAEPLALVAELGLTSRLEAGRVVGERAQARPGAPRPPRHRASAPREPARGAAARARRRARLGEARRARRRRRARRAGRRVVRAAAARTGRSSRSAPRRPPRRPRAPPLRPQA